MGEPGLGCGSSAHTPQFPTPTSCRVAYSGSTHLRIAQAGERLLYEAQILATIYEALQAKPLLPLSWLWPCRLWCLSSLGASHVVAGARDLSVLR